MMPNARYRASSSSIPSTPSKPSASAGSSSKHNTASGIPSTQQQGFTLLELLVGLSIVGILAGAAMPTLTQLRTEQRINAASTAMLNSIALAKSKAVHLGHNILIAPAACDQFDEPHESNTIDSTIDTTINNTNAWPCGWLVVVDTNHNSVADPSDAVLQRVIALTGVRMIHNVRTATLEVRPSGRVVPMQSIEVCASSRAHTNQLTYTQTIVISITGRPRVESTRHGSDCTA